MGAKVAVGVAEIDGILKAMLTLSRATERVLESSSVSKFSGETVGVSKVQVLRLLNTQGEQMPSQVARFLGVSKPAVSQIISAMLRSKLIAKKAKSVDGREVYICLTKHGKTAFHEVVKEQRHLVRTALKHVGNGEAKTWAASMHSISSAISRADKTFDDYCLQCGAHADGRCVLQGGDSGCAFMENDKKFKLDRPRGSK